VTAPASDARSQVTALQKRMGESIIGQEHIIERLIIGLLSNGNLLVEGLPGLAKTRAVKSLAKNLDAGLSRIQFTPDLLPSDITGTEVYYQANGKSEFRFEQGPIFAWWDQTERRMRTARLPATIIDVAPAVSAASTSSIAFKDEEAEGRAEAARLAAERRRRERLILGAAATAVALLVLVWIARRTARTIVHLAVNAWQRMRDSEPIYFLRALRASRGGDAQASYQTALEWSTV
jgi:hypothetical protein